MEDTEAVYDGSLVMFITLKGSYKVCCRYCNETLCFYNINNFIEHWIAKHTETVTWFSDSASSSKDIHLRLPGQAVLVIKPSTHSFEIHCNMCILKNVFHNEKNYISHFLKYHQNPIKKPSYDEAITHCDDESCKNLSSNSSGTHSHMNTLCTETNKDEGVCSQTTCRPKENGIELTPIGDYYKKDEFKTDNKIVNQSLEGDVRKVFRTEHLIHFSQVQNISILISTYLTQELGCIGELGRLVSNSIQDSAKNLSYENKLSQEEMLNEIHMNSEQEQELPSSINSEDTNNRECSVNTPKPSLKKSERKVKANNAEQNNNLQENVTDPFICTICSKYYKRKYHYDSHMSKWHPSTECSLNKDASQTTSLKCKICNSIFKNPTQYRRHAFSMHEIIEPFECPQCGIKFQYFQAFESHLKICRPLDEV